MVCGCAVRLSLGVRQKQQPAMAVAQVELRTAVRRAEAKALLLFARVVSPPNQQREEYEEEREELLRKFRGAAPKNLRSLNQLTTEERVKAWIAEALEAAKASWVEELRRAGGGAPRRRVGRGRGRWHHAQHSYKPPR